jgi:hypothetical protein
LQFLKASNLVLILHIYNFPLWSFKIIMSSVNILVSPLIEEIQHSLSSVLEELIFLCYSPKWSSD